MMTVEEYQHGRSALEAVQLLMARLEEYRGRKDLIFFTQNAVLEPRALYRHADPRSVLADPDQQADYLSAAALTSRVGLTVAGIELATDIGHHLAELTGGQYSHSYADYEQVIDRAGRACCLYRLAFRPPDTARRSLFQAAVFARGRRLPATYRVEILPEQDRWMRHAAAVLSRPNLPREIHLDGTLLPTARRDGRWEASLFLAFDSSELSVLPVGEIWQGRCEIAALVENDKAGRTAELPTTVEVNRGQKGGPRAVFGGVVGNLKPGTSRLKALVGTREERRFGGAEAGIDLPSRGANVSLGPYLLVEERTPLMLSLPSPDGIAPLPSGSAPLLVGPIAAGNALIAVTLQCGGTEAPTTATRFLSRDGEDVLHVEGGTPEPAGECVRLVDRIETSSLSGGTYQFNVTWGEADLVSAPFMIAPLAAAPPAR